MSKKTKTKAKVVYGFSKTKDGLAIYKKLKNGGKLGANESIRFTDVRAMMVEAISKQMDDLRALRHSVYTSKEKNFSKLQKQINKR